MTAVFVVLLVALSVLVTYQLTVVERRRLRRLEHQRRIQALVAASVRSTAALRQMGVSMAQVTVAMQRFTAAMQEVRRG